MTLTKIVVRVEIEGEDKEELKAAVEAFARQVAEIGNRNARDVTVFAEEMIDFLIEDGTTKPA